MQDTWDASLAIFLNTFRKGRDETKRFARFGVGASKRQLSTSSPAPEDVRNGREADMELPFAGPLQDTTGVM
jgi:hypothetical protein